MSYIPPSYIYAMKRTVIGQTLGYHKNTLPEDLMASILRHLTAEIDVESIEDCLLANSVGPMGNMARLSWLTANLPITTPATTLDFQCGGGLKAIQLAASLSKTASGLFVAGGLESTSLEPQRAYNPLDPRKASHPGLLARAQFSPAHMGDVDMLQGAENTALRFGFSRQALDDYALLSHHRALAAHERGIYRDLILPSAQGHTVDESLRPSISARLLSRAKPILSPTGLTTPGNACLMHDGAAAVVMGSEIAGHRLNLKPLAKIIDCVSVGCEPGYSPIGPIPAVQKLLAKHNLDLDQIHIIEINEAFAAKVLAFHSATKYPIDQINPHGGALAYGHPYAASGTIYTMHLIEGLYRRGGGLGIVTLGVAGGQGIACLIEVNGQC